MDDDILDDGSDGQSFPNKLSFGGLPCKNVSSDAGSLKFINQVLMEDYDSLENSDTSMIQKSALDATEKSLYDVLYNNSIVFPSHEAQLHIHDIGLNADHNKVLLKDSDNSSVQRNYINSLHGKNQSKNQKDHLLSAELIENAYNDFHQVEDDNLGEMINENLSSYDAEPWLVDLFNSAMFLCDPSSSSMDLNEKRQSKRSTRKRKKEGVDLRALLLKCMEYLLLKSDHEKAKHLLSQIQQLSSPTGNGSQRLAHYFAIGIEAHLTSKNLLNKNLPLYLDFDKLKGYKQLFDAFPLFKTSNFAAAEKIIEVADKEDTIHLIHFGDVIGLHLAPIIQRLSKRPGGPPKLRITGINLYESGPNPAVKNLQHLLEEYCEKVNIPFEYNEIALNWKTLSIDDLKMKEGELSVAVCFFIMHFVSDDTILEGGSPRDDVLNLIKRINPDIFIHGTTNGTYNSPFLISRFREALFYFSIYFDMFDTILPIDEPDRLFYEETCGRRILNSIACEGLNRVDRPETYRQWNSRMLRKGFRQLPLNRQIVEKVATLVKTSYHKDFFVDESCQCMVQGWKTRVLTALSFWKLP